MTINVPTEGFAVPPVPASTPSVPPVATQNVPTPPPTPKPAGAAPQEYASLTQTPQTVDPAQYKAFLEYQAAKAAQVPPAVPQPAQASEPPKVLTDPSTAIDVVLDNKTSDPILQSLTGIFVNSAKGIDMHRALGNALQYGDTNLIDVAYIREVGKENADHLLSVAKGIVSRVEEASQEVVKYAHDTAGGQAQWDAAAAAFSEKAPAHLKLVIKSMLDSGNGDAIKSAMSTVVDYARQGGFVAKTGQQVQSGAAVPASSQALSKAEFQALHVKLDKNSRTYEQEARSLIQRRALGKSLGR